jgi:hypothetical protein
VRRKLAVALVILTSLASIALTQSSAQGSTPTKINLQKRLVACGSLPNGSTSRVVQTSRMFINLPKDIYPTKILYIVGHGATAGYISNGGPYGYAIGARGKPNCWSTSFEFNVTPYNPRKSGTVDIGSKSAIRGIPNYLIHIRVVPNPSDIGSTTKGNIQGRVLLGPICPVERIPADPSCAPKPYKTTVEIFVATAANPFKTVTTNATGAFYISLLPGAYLLRAHGGSMYPRCADVSVNVSAGKTGNVIVNCDTGIR